MCLLTAASKVTPTPEQKNPSFEILYSVEGMLLCREADTRLAHCSLRAIFGGAEVCTKLFVGGKNCRVRNLGERERQKDDKRMMSCISCKPGCCFSMRCWAPLVTDTL